MNLVYELNPPKIVRGDKFDLPRLKQDLTIMVERAAQLADHVDGIHLTDSVLGIPRVSSVTAARLIRDSGVRAKLSVSLRSRDRNTSSMCQEVSDAIMLGVDSALILMGDEPADSKRDSGLRPTDALKILRGEGYHTEIKLNLSFPAKVSDRCSPSILAKFGARPHSIVTQSISSLSDLGEIVDLAKSHGVRVIACIMVPSEKNSQSASIVGIDWSKYERDPADFIKQAAKMSDGVLLTSPNSFSSGIELLQQLGR